MLSVHVRPMSPAPSRSPTGVPTRRRSIWWSASLRPSASAGTITVSASPRLLEVDPPGSGPRGWRRKEHPCGKLRKGYLRVATSRLANPHPRDVEAPLRLVLKPAGRAEASRTEIDDRLGIPGSGDGIRGFIGHVRHRADLTGRRIPGGGTVPHSGKVHSILKPHARWISKGKAGPRGARRPRPRAGDRHGFVPHQSVMWEGSDMDVAVPMGGEAFRGARRAQAAGGSAINKLEHRGLDRVRSHGKEGFAGAVALTANVHRPGLMPRGRERPVLPAA